MIIIIGYGCQMGVKNVIDVSTIHAIKGKSKLYANSFGTKRPWVRVPSPRPGINPCKSLDYAVCRDFCLCTSDIKFAFFTLI